MPTFKVTDNITGKTLRLTGDSPPTEQELEQIFQQFRPEEGLAKRSLIPTSIAGATGFGTVEGAEDILPAAGQIAGSVAGFPGSVAGATLGQAARQGVRAIRGKEVINPITRDTLLSGPISTQGPIPKEAARTATLEGVFRGGGNLLKGGANRMMNSLIRPGKDILKRRPRFGLDALELGIVTGKHTF